MTDPRITSSRQRDIFCLPPTELTLEELRTLSRDEARVQLYNRHRYRLTQQTGDPTLYRPVTAIPASRRDLITFYDNILDGQTGMFREDLP